MARRTRPQDHQLGWNFRKRSFADSHCYVVAQFEKRYRRDRNRQSCHHGTKWFLLPELLSDERSDEHRRIRFGQQIMHSALTTDLHWRNVLIFSVSRRTFDGVHLHVYTPETHTTVAPAVIRQGELVVWTARTSRISGAAWTPFANATIPQVTITPPISSTAGTNKTKREIIKRLSPVWAENGTQT